jgi:hypothetical protein
MKWRYVVGRLGLNYRGKIWGAILGVHSLHPEWGYRERLHPSRLRFKNDNEVKRLEGPPMIWQSLPVTPDLRIFGLHILVQIWEQRLSN